MTALKIILALAWLVVGSRLLAELAYGIRRDVEELKKTLREEEKDDTRNDK